MNIKQIIEPKMIVSGTVLSNLHALSNSICINPEEVGQNNVTTTHNSPPPFLMRKLKCSKVKCLVLDQCHSKWPTKGCWSVNCLTFTVIFQWLLLTSISLHFSFHVQQIFIPSPFWSRSCTEILKVNMKYMVSI